MTQKMLLINCYAHEEVSEYRDKLKLLSATYITCMFGRTRVPYTLVITLQNQRVLLKGEPMKSSVV